MHHGRGSRRIAPRYGRGPRRGPKWARRSHRGTAQPRDWIQISVTALPGLAAVIALIFTWQSINATDVQLQVTEQGQITDRYNAAITNLGSSSEDVRLGGIYALQRLMQDSPRDQPTVVSVLCAYVRDHSKLPRPDPSGGPRVLPVTADVQAALAVVGSRDPANDGKSTVVDLSSTDLMDADLVGADLVDATLVGANLTDANLNHANLNHAKLGGANLYHTNLGIADLSNADLDGTNLSAAQLSSADLSSADLSGGANLSSADLTGANLTGGILDHANLTGAFLIQANLRGADLTGADLRDAELTGADLTGAIRGRG